MAPFHSRDTSSTTTASVCKSFRQLCRWIVRTYVLIAIRHSKQKVRWIYIKCLSTQSIFLQPKQTKNAVRPGVVFTIVDSGASGSGQTESTWLVMPSVLANIVYTSAAAPRFEGAIRSCHFHARKEKETDKKNRNRQISYYFTTEQMLFDLVGA